MIGARPLGLLAIAACAAALGPGPAAAADTGPSAAAPAGRVLHVGPTRALRAPSQAAAVARDGDTIEIDAATYRDCAVWRAGPLTIRGVGGRPRIEDVSCQGKALWVVYGSATTIDNVAFAGARVPGRNGAGIRFEGGSLVVRASEFRNNQMGILTHNKRHSWLVVDGSTFEENGDCADFCGHGIYAGLIKGLKVYGSTFRGHKHGHHIKSRAAYNEIVGNRIEDGPGGTASFAIDLPNGGTAFIRNNVLQKGRLTENRTAMIAIGEEGIRNPSKGIVVEGNVFMNLMARPTSFVWSRGVPVRMAGNSFNGPGERLRLSQAVRRRR